MSNKFQITFSNLKGKDFLISDEDWRNLNAVIFKAMEDDGTLYQELLKNPVETLKMHGVSEEAFVQLIDAARTGNFEPPTPEPTMPVPPVLEDIVSDR